jgi:GTP cyclohydrolase II
MTYRRVASARLPVHTDRDVSFEMIVFAADDLDASCREVVVLSHGAPAGAPPLVRVHSACLTGDALGSLRCDCGDQLNEALRLLADASHGIMVYLPAHEGRGIGLANKLRAYALQDEGHDTVDANTLLGLAVDARCYAAAADVLLQLGAHRIALLTNNPAKIAQLEQHGIEVAERVPLWCSASSHNGAYLAAKRYRMGHLASAPAPSSATHLTRKVG